jgi:GNAT superfamily N-acetyltransferase
MSEKLVIRPAVTSEASRLTQLVIERKFDADPWDRKSNEASIEWWNLYGDAANLADIERAQQFPSNYFICVAAIGKTVVGYLKGSSSLKSEYTYEGRMHTDHRGLMVAKNHESQGVAQGLEREFCEWAVQRQQPVCVRVAVGNERAHDFFKQQGYEYRQTLPATPESPSLDVFTLSYDDLYVNTRNQPPRNVSLSLERNTA